GRSPWLVGAAAQDLSARGAHRPSRRKRLLFAFDRAGASDHDNLVTADLEITHFDLGLLGMEVPATQLVLLGYAQDLLDSLERFERLIERRRQRRRADEADDRPLLSG